MSSELVAVLADHGSGFAAAALAVAVGVRAISPMFCTWIEQRWLTRRFGRALEGATPKQRAKIIRALRKLEKKARPRPVRRRRKAGRRRV
jgi:hypothetical protein